MQSQASRIVIAASGLGVFVAVVATQGLLLAPSFDPANQTVSEYAHSEAGAMVAGFLAWALSWAVLATFAPALPPRAGGLGPRLATTQKIAFAGAAAGLVLVACFATDRGAVQPGVVTDLTPAGRAHDAASALVTLSVTVAALAGAALLGGRTGRLTLVSIAAAFGAGLLMLALGDPVPGVRQRILVALGCLWQALWLSVLWRSRTARS